MMYVIKYVIDIKKYFMIPKTYNFVAQGVKIFCPSYIILFLFYMLTSIYFHYEFGFKTHKIHDVGFDYILTSEFVPSQTTIPQMVPE